MHSSIRFPSEAREEMIDLCDLLARHGSILAFQGIPFTPRNPSLPRRPYLAFLDAGASTDFRQLQFEDRAAVLAAYDYQEMLRDDYDIHIPARIDIYRIPVGVKLRAHMPYHAALWKHAVERGIHFDVERLTPPSFFERA